MQLKKIPYHLNNITYYLVESQKVQEKYKH
jgi:hypothetical protein